MKKLWILKVTDEGDDLLDYDHTYGLLVRAKSAPQARKLTSQRTIYQNIPKNFWTNAELTTCQELRMSGPEGVILEDHRAG